MYIEMLELCIEDREIIKTLFISLHSNVFTHFTILGETAQKSHQLYSRATGRAGAFV